MSKEIDIIDGYQILELRNGYMVRNLDGKYSKHTHLKKKKTCYSVISFVIKREIPKKEYLIKSCIKIALDEKYLSDLNSALNKRKKKKVNNYRNYMIAGYN